MKSGLDLLTCHVTGLGYYQLVGIISHKGRTVCVSETVGRALSFGKLNQENEDIHQENCCYSFTTTGVKRSGLNMF
jgi:hypothetical protein